MRDIQCKSCVNLKDEWCKKIIYIPNPDLVRDCQYYRMRTNADRIRDMTDEELALLFARNDCPDDGKERDLKSCDIDIDTCQRCWLDWIRQEVEQ